MDANHWMVQWLACWTSNREVHSSNPGSGRNLGKDFCSACAPSQLSYDEYTDRNTFSGKMRRQGRGLLRLRPLLEYKSRNRSERESQCNINNEINNEDELMGTRKTK